MAQRKTLTQRQVDVLRWIGDGCPDGVIVREDYSERITAGALRNRGLVTTTGRGRTWSAAITKDGIDYLARVDGPNPPIPREPNRPVPQRLVDEVIAAGGTLRVPRRPWGAAGTGQPDCERRVALAEHRGVVPPGKRLVITRDSGELQIDLRDAPEGSPTAPMPVPVPERVARYHPVVAGFRGQKDRHEVSRAQLSRVSGSCRGWSSRPSAGATQHGCPRRRRSLSRGAPTGRATPMVTC